MAEQNGGLFAAVPSGIRREEFVINMFLPTLVTTTGIIAILIGLLLPAVQR